MNIRMSLILRMDRPIRANHYVCPGGYSLTLENGSSFAFDFMEHSGCLKGSDIHYEMRDLEVYDEDSEASDELYARFAKELLLSPVVRLNEVFVYTGEYDDPEINLESVEEMQFFVFEGEGEEMRFVPVPKTVIKRYNKEVIGRET